MVNKDYRKELDLVSPQKMVPRPVAIVALLGAAVALSFGAMQVVEAAKKRHHPPAATAAPVATPAQ